MKKIERSILCTLLLFILSGLAMGSDILISNKEITVTAQIDGYNITIPGLAIYNLDKFRKTYFIDFSSNNTDWSNLQNFYLHINGESVRLNNNQDTNHIIEKLSKLIGTGCSPLELKYQHIWGCTSAGHAYYVLKQLYPADTDFTRLYEGMSDKNVSDFAREHHVIGELFAFELKLPGVKAYYPIFNFFSLGRNIYAMMFDHSMIVIPKRKLIEFIQNSDHSYYSGDIVLNMAQSTVRPLAPSPSARSQIHDFLESQFHLSINLPHILNGIVATLLIAVPLALYSRFKSKSNNIETTNTHSKKKSGKHPDNGVDDLPKRKPEVPRSNPQIGETVMLLPAPSTVNNTHELTDRELNDIIRSLQQAHRQQEGSLPERQVNLLRVLRNRLADLDNNGVRYDLNDIINHNRIVRNNIHNALKVKEHLDFGNDGLPDSLTRRLNKKFRL